MAEEPQIGGREQELVMHGGAASHPPLKGRVGARSAPGWGELVWMLGVFACHLVEPSIAFAATPRGRLRANPTSAEDRLWRHLRRLPIHGSHFRRQVPIGPYIADFACMAARLIIEIDGSQHGTDVGIARDSERTQWLRQEGYRVIRFWNNDLSQNIEGVLETIHAALYGSRDADASVLKHERRSKGAARHPTPPASGGRPSPFRGG